MKSRFLIIFLLSSCVSINSKFDESVTLFLDIEKNRKHYLDTSYLANLKIIPWSSSQGEDSAYLINRELFEYTDDLKDIWSDCITTKNRLEEHISLFKSIDEKQVDNFYLLEKVGRNCTTDIIFWNDLDNEEEAVSSKLNKPLKSFCFGYRYRLKNGKLAKSDNFKNWILEKEKSPFSEVSVHPDYYLYTILKKDNAKNIKCEKSIIFMN